MEARGKEVADYEEEQVWHGLLIICMDMSFLVLLHFKTHAINRIKYIVYE